MHLDHRRLRPGNRADIEAIEEVARRAWPSTWHPGGLAWALGRTDEVAWVEIFSAGGDPVAVVSLDGPGEPLTPQVDPAAGREVAEAVVGWLLSQAEAADEVVVDLTTNDRLLVDAVTRAGFERDDDHHVHGMFHDAGPGAARPVVEGYRIRATTADEVEARVEVHRAAWLPAALPYHPDHRPPVAPGATSSYSLDKHLAVAADPLYDPGLDLVAEAADGALAACALVWFDPALGCAEIEPLGVHPDHRRRGLAGALCLEAVARVGERGGDLVFMNGGPRVEYPANHGAYSKAGFRTEVRGWRWRRPAPEAPQP